MMWKLLALGAVIVVLGAVVVWQLVDRRRLRARYRGILDLDREIALRRHVFERELANREIELAGEVEARRTAIDGEVAARTSELEHARRAAMAELLDIMRKTSELQHSYTTTADAYERARAELAALEDSADAVALGLYPPSFAPSAPADYKRRLRDAREHQRAMVRDDRAISYGAWSSVVRGDGERMQRQYARLLLRAFHGECEAAIAKVRWNNFARMAERLSQAFNAINRLGAVMQIQLTAAYRDCKLDELRLEYELDRAAAPSGGAAGRGHAPAVEHQRRVEHEEQRARRVPAGLVDAAGLDDAARSEVEADDLPLARGSIKMQRLMQDARAADETRITLSARAIVHAADPDVKPAS